MTCSFFFSRANCFLFLLCKLILTPAASVAPVQSDLPAVTSCSSASNASQVYKHIRACQPLICCLPTSGCYRQLAWANLQEENSQVTSHEYNKHFFFFFFCGCRVLFCITYLELWPQLWLQQPPRLRFIRFSQVRCLKVHQKEDNLRSQGLRF